MLILVHKTLVQDSGTLKSVQGGRGLGVIEVGKNFLNKNIIVSMSEGIDFMNFGLHKA